MVIPAFVGAAAGCDLLVFWSFGLLVFWIWGLIHWMRHGALRVPPLRRVPFGKQPQKEPKRPCPSVRPSLRSGSLATVPLRGHAVTGHPWPNTALPASMPVDPLRRTSSRPPEGQADQKPVQKQDQLPAEAAYRPTFLAKHISLNRPAGNRVSTGRRNAGA